MSNYQKNKLAAQTRTVNPTLTDQSQARETDINVIVGRMGITGAVPGNSQPPMYGDFTNLPTDLREFIECARTIGDHWKHLPPELKGMGMDELLALTPEELTTKLTPPAPTPDKETKE